MEEASCIFCGKYSDHIAITENGYKGVKCLGCNLIYISPRPSASDVTHLYTDAHAVLYADAQFRFEQFNRMAAARTLSKIGRYRKSGSVLELGPGGGSFLAEARKFGYESYGIELNPIERRWITDKLHIPCEDVALNEKSFGGRRFDIVYHKDVLSHLDNPIEAFRCINNALKNNGLLVFETGNIADVDEKFYKYFSQFSYPDHLFFFGEKSLRMLLEVAGFKCIRIYRESLMFQLLLQKALWKRKDSLKEERAVESMNSEQAIISKTDNLSLKRRVRLLYRYVSHYLIRCGSILPKRGRPLKLVVIAEKNVATPLAAC